jgi:peroxin-3
MSSMGLKRELSPEDWESYIREVRARVETQSTDEGASLYSFVPHILPPYPLPETISTEYNPLPHSTPTDRLHLMSLVEQTESHLVSADGTFLIEKGVSAMIRKLLESLKEDAYSGSEIGLILGEPQAINATRRLVDCLPTIDRWGKGVWEGIPDSGIEVSFLGHSAPQADMQNLTAIPEFEGFAALVFGDWAPRD